MKRNYANCSTFPKLLDLNSDHPLHKKWSFSFKSFLVYMTKCAVNCRLCHIYWRNPWWKTSFFVQWPLKKNLFFWSNPYKIKVMMTFFTEILDLPSFVTSAHPQFGLSYVLKLCWSRHDLFHRNTRVAKFCHITTFTIWFKSRLKTLLVTS